MFLTYSTTNLYLLKSYYVTICVRGDRTKPFFKKKYISRLNLYDIPLRFLKKTPQGGKYHLELSKKKVEY